MVWFVVLAVITAGLALGLPPDPDTLHKLHISSLTYRIAVLVILIPYGVIWYAAFYAFAKLKDYARAIKGSEDGRAFQKITAGMGILAYGLIIPTTVSIVLQNIAMHHAAFKPVAVIVVNYLGLLVLSAFIFVGNGTRMLADTGRYRPSLNGLRVFALSYIALAVLFTYLVTHFQSRHPHAYYLNMPLLIFTFIIPYIFGWFTALLSAYEFGLYAKYVNGILYRQALRQLSSGIIVTIIGWVIIQFVTATFDTRANKSLGSLLILEYLLLMIVASGLSLMALGTKKLMKIEEV